MSILLDNDCSDIKPRLCTTDDNNHLHINQKVIGFLSGFVPIGIHHVPYPGTGESGNKITSAYDEALKTVGYGRLEKQCTIYYNNPFDPRLTFNGLGHLLTVTDTEAGSMSKEQLTQNVFLALENTNLVMDDFLNQSRIFYQALCSTTDLDLHVDPNRYKLFPEIDGNVSDDGSEDCKRMFSKISSLPVKNIWGDTPGTTGGAATVLRSDQTTEKTGTAKEECRSGTGETPSKEDEDPDPPHINKIRYSYQRLEGKNKSSVEPAWNASMSPEEASTYDHVEREIEQVMSEESDPEEPWDDTRFNG
ncbi:uncharacterized protein LOC117325648 [Pecten maximus]|uniref:uncharacterized protein LOC117325648 n=1 Tax=Pecten maximus TaxID=6579 RepID=UPI00145918E1|nr:uncharacterized protein LOC117325648 [Pecten maximus]